MMSYELPDGDSINRDNCLRLDAGDPLSKYRDDFALPTGVVYLDGMSLGARPVRALERVNQVVENEWGQGLVRSWNTSGWMDAPRRIGHMIARLIGASSDEVIVADSTSVNLFKLLVAALRLRPGRTVVLSDTSNFPNDLYIFDGVRRLLGNAEVRLVGSDDLVDAIDDQVAVVALTHVDFKSGQQYDIPLVTGKAHTAGALVLWDLSHSAGAVPVDLREANVDLAVGCSYKYLNGGPGAPAYLFVAQRLQSELQQPISGWMGHARPFEFDNTFEPDNSIARFQSGTPPIIALATLEASLEIWNDIDLSVVRAKSIAMSELFIGLVERECDQFNIVLRSPRDPSQRGSHVAFEHPDGYAVMQALIDRGVIGDFRAPNLMRFGFTPLYLSFADVWKAAETLTDILRTDAWNQSKYKSKMAVT
jgi:kynureninase